MQTLPISLAVRVSLAQTATLAQRVNFGRGLIIGSSTNARETLYGIYSTIDAVKEDYGVEASEYLVAQKYFLQQPKPRDVMIATVVGSVGTPAQINSTSIEPTALETFQTTNSGNFVATINGNAVSVPCPDFSEAADFDDVADIMAAAINTPTPLVTITQADGLYTVTTLLTGVGASIAVTVGGGAVSDLFNFYNQSDVGTGGAFNHLQAIETVWDSTQSFYGFCYADGIAAVDIQDVIEWAQANYRMLFAVLANSTQAVSTGNTLKVLNLDCYTIQYHADLNTVGALMGMALDQKFDTKDGIKTLKFKSLIGVTPSEIGQTLAANLDVAGVNYYAAYGNEDNPTTWFSQGYAGGKKFFDFVIGLHWLRDAIETNVLNTFLRRRKIDQTEEGMSELKSSVARGLGQGVNNGLIAAGQWNGEPVGTVQTGDWLENGYYIYADKIANQEQSIRNTREAPPMTVIVKGAGALHGADITIIPEA